MTWNPRSDEETKDDIRPIKPIEGVMNERSFAGWLQDLVAESVEEDGAHLESIKSLDAEGLPGLGFIVRIDGKEFEVRVSRR